jgi:hypothetical protein
MESLLLCPWCGCAPIIESYMAKDHTKPGIPRVPGASIRCDNCGADKTYIGVDGECEGVARDAATDMWNQRADEADMTIDHFVFLAKSYALEKDAHMTPAAIVLANKVREAMREIGLPHPPTDARGGESTTKETK